MELTWGGLVLVLLAGAVAWFWRDSLQVREHANRAAMEACARLSLQFLDGTVAFTRLRIARQGRGWVLLRWYVFDYTAHSIDRLQGFVSLRGAEVESVGFARQPVAAAAVRTHASDTESAASFTDGHPPAEAASSSAEAPNRKGVEDNILDLQAWRRHKSRSNERLN
jgi:hypothetical protein